jgi:hypothetical protein
MMKNLIMLALLIILISNPAYSMLRGNNIYPACDHILDESRKKELKTMEDILKYSLKATFCVTATGVSFQAIRGVGYIWSVDDKFARCMEDYYGFADINGEQILDMTMKYLKNHPELRNIEINVIMASMLQEQYPPTVCGASIKNMNKK